MDGAPFNNFPGLRLNTLQTEGSGSAAKLERQIFIDFHTHYASCAPLPVPPEVWRVISTPLSDINQLMPPGTIQTLELHPWSGAAWTPEFEQAASLERFSGIGEVGLDRLRGKRPLDEQLKILAQACNLAEKLQKPLTIHCVKCFSELLALYKELRWQVPTIIHYFRGNLPLAQQLWEHTHFTLSLPPAALSQQQLMEFLRNHPEYIRRIVLETDDPLHGNIQKHYQQCAKIWSIPLTELQQIMSKQLEKLYYVNK